MTKTLFGFEVRESESTKQQIEGLRDLMAFETEVLSPEPKVLPFIVRKDIEMAKKLKLSKKANRGVKAIRSLAKSMEKLGDDDLVQVVQRVSEMSKKVSPDALAKASNCLDLIERERKAKGKSVTPKKKQEKKVVASKKAA